MLVVDESLHGKYLKVFEMMNNALPGPEPTLHRSDQLVWLEEPEESTIDHLLHAFAYKTCTSNRVIVGRVVGFQIMIGFFQSAGKHTVVQIWLKSREMHEMNQAGVLKFDSGHCLVLTVLWDLCRASRSSSTQNNSLYTFVFPNLKFMVCFLVFFLYWKKDVCA